ncbi:MAG: FHA domain-containing protein [Candidatus Marinimicrobia bacterium]|nr:FHA domain-containing protein [Candidatus Neomarinimicrobiota bacterium]
MAEWLIKALSGPLDGKTFPLTEGNWVVGRSAANDVNLVLADPTISRRHVELTVTPAELRLRDLGSNNGALVNGVRVGEAVLSEGDEVRLGNTLLRIGAAAGATPSLIRRNQRREALSVPDMARELLAQRAHGPDPGAGLSALFRSGQAAFNVHTLEKLAQKTCDLVFEQFPEADRCTVLFEAAGAKAPVVEASRARTGGPSAVGPFYSRTVAEAARRERVALWVEDAIADERFTQSVSIRLQQIRSALCVPLEARGDVHGLIYVDARVPTSGFEAGDLKTLTLIGLQVAAAVENVRLQEQLEREKNVLEQTNQQLKQAQRQLIQAVKLATVGQMVAGLAHDVRNPLTIALNYAGILRRQLKGEMPPDVEDLEPDTVLAEIQGAIQHCNTVIERLLQFARGKPPERTAVPVRQLIEDAGAFLRHELRVAKVRLLFDWPEEELTVQADRDQLYQVCLNLMMNAIQAMPEGGVLTLGCAREQNEQGVWILLTVADTGVGLTTEEMDKVFDPFYSSRKGPDGFGLGLSVSYAIVNQHGGALEVTSRKQIGSCFTIRLPARETHEPWS